MNKEILQPYVKRFLLILLISSIGIFIISEASYRLQRHNIDRGPETIDLVIPEGTAELVENGEPVPAIPEEMVFILGDVLVIYNWDTVVHELGLVAVPPGSSVSIPMEESDSYVMSCSFATSSYLGFEIKEATTWRTRLLALSFAAPATAVIAFLYSLAAVPIKPLNKDE